MPHTPLRWRVPRVGTGSDAQTTAMAVAIARICNVADRPKQGQTPMTAYVALSIVSPQGQNIASGKKTIEVRSWQPPALPIKDLLIVENSIFLTHENQVDPNGRAVALVDVRFVEAWLPSQVESACSSGWKPGYFAWHLHNVRPLARSPRVAAERRLYTVELSHAEMSA